MRIEHLAIWVRDLERMIAFYESYFDAGVGERYTNHSRHFRSCFLTFREGCRLELMNQPDIEAFQTHQTIGLAHFALSLGSKEKVDTLTERLRNDGYTVAGEPRTTGDGYYESVVLDPEGNRIELTV